jgi:RNA polymerase sigma factor (sigma-70 family)
MSVTIPEYVSSTTVTSMEPVTDTHTHSLSEDLYNEIYAVSYRVAYKLMGHREASEDVAIETLAKLLEKNILDEDHAHGYAARVASRLVISGWRKDAVRRKYAHKLLPDNESPAGDLSNIRLDLRQALKKLSARQRDVVVMRYLADISEADTARALNLSVGTVKSTSHDALNRLRTMVEVMP